MIRSSRLLRPQRIAPVAGSLSHRRYFTAGQSVGEPQVVETVSKIGDMKSMGLCNWTPPGLAESLFEYIHVTTGMPWWATIAVATLTARALIFPVMAKSYRSTMILKQIHPEVKEVMAKMEIAKATDDQKGRIEAMQELMALYSAHGIHPLGGFRTILFSAPVSISFFLAIRDMSALSFMKHGGALWFNDLTLPDPTYILPIAASAGFLYVTETGQTAQNDQMKMIFRVLGVAGIPLMASFPSALSFYWVCNSACSVAAATLMKTAMVKKMFDIPDISAAAQDSTLVGVKQPGFSDSVIDTIKVAKNQKEREYHRRLYGDSDEKGKRAIKIK